MTITSPPSWSSDGRFVLMIQNEGEGTWRDPTQPSDLRSGYRLRGEENAQAVVRGERPTLDIATLTFALAA